MSIGERLMVGGTLAGLATVVGGGGYGAYKVQQKSANGVQERQDRDDRRIAQAERDGRFDDAEAIRSTRPSDFQQHWKHVLPMAGGGAVAAAGGGLAFVGTLYSSEGLVGKAARAANIRSMAALGVATLGVGVALGSVASGITNAIRE